MFILHALLSLPVFRSLESVESVFEVVVSFFKVVTYIL